MSHGGAFAKKLHIIHRNVLFKETLITVFRDVHDFEVVDQLPCHSMDCGRSEGQHHATIALIDLAHPHESALQLIRSARAVEGNNVRFVVLAPGPEQEEIIQCVAEGALGCVLEESSLDEVTTAIRAAAEGQPYCSPRIWHTVFSKLSTMRDSSQLFRPQESVELTPREFEVLRFVAEHLSNKEIAKLLCVSLHTVKNHVRNILFKLKVDSRSKAVEHAYRRNLLSHSIGQAQDTRSFLKVKAAC